MKKLLPSFHESIISDGGMWVEVYDFHLVALRSPLPP